MDTINRRALLKILSAAPVAASVALTDTAVALVGTPQSPVPLYCGASLKTKFCGFSGSVAPPHSG